MLQLHLSDQQFYWLLRCDIYQRFDGNHYPLRMHWVIKSLKPSHALWHDGIWSTLLQVMACYPFGKTPLLQSMLTWCQVDIWEQNSKKCYLKYNYFHKETDFENAVCKISTILFKPQYIMLMIDTAPYIWPNCCRILEIFAMSVQFYHNKWP